MIDNLSVGLPEPAPRLGLQFHRADVRDAAAMNEIVAGFAPDLIVHLAAVHHIPTCEARRPYALEVNVVGTEVVLEAAARAQVRRLVLASSGAVYDWAPGPLDESDSPLRPSDNYALAKYANETQARLWASRAAGRVAVARIFNTIGPNDPNGHLVPDIIAQIPPGASRVRVSLGNLTPRRDYIHVDDTATAIARIAECSFERDFDVFNVASGADLSVRELVEELGRVMSVAIEIVDDPTRRRPIDRPSQLGAIGKIQSRLGFAPRLGLRDALADIVRHSGRQLDAAQ